MVAAIAIVLAIVVILLVVIPWLLKATYDIEKDIEDHILDPGTPKVAYLVPNGVDAAIVSNALTAAGFISAIQLVAGEERLLVEAGPGDRERVRAVIESVNNDVYATSGLTIGAVVFADEP